MSKSALPKELEETSLGMTNFDHSIDEGLEAVLKQGKHFCLHSAWNFNAKVWWDGQTFVSEVWRFHQIVDLKRADTLPGLMEMVNDDWGSE